MISDTQVVFRNIEHSDAVEFAVQKRLQKLERYCDEIQSLKVTLETPHNNHYKGKVYHVGVEALVPNHDIVVTHDQHDNQAHEDIYVAIRDAFNAVERRLKSVYGKQRSRMQRNPKLADTMTVTDPGL
jgi:ribosomal subunit interface protein